MMFEVMGVERWEKMRPYVVVGNVVKVSFDISSREWNERWFTSLTAFSVYGGGNTAAPQSEAPVESKPAPVETAPSKTDDLPF